MISLFRLKGRGFIIGNVSLVSLFLFTAGLFIFCLNFLPEVLSQVLSASAMQFKTPVLAMFCVLLIFVCFCIFVCVKYGTDRFFMRKAQNKGATARDFFYYFHPKATANLVLFEMRLSLLKIAACFLCFSPAILCMATLMKLWQNTSSLKVSLILMFSFAVFLINGLAFFSRFVSLLFLAPYYYIEGSFLNFNNIISMSFSVMEKKRKLLSKLRWSFSGWFFLCLLIVPSGYVYAYYKQTLCVAADEFMNK